MRLIHTFSNDQDAKTLSAFLTQKEIENELDMIKNTDWGSSEYGNIICRVWVIDEDDAEEAHKWLELFLKNPNDPMFVPLRPSSSLLLQPFAESHRQKERKPRPPKPASKRAATLSLYIIIGCTLLYILTGITSSYPESAPKNLSTPLFSSPIKQALFYDYPQAYERINKLVSTYGFDVLTNPSKLPPEGRHILQKFNRTPFWQGLYEKIVKTLRKPGTPLTFHEPMFEKIRKGEIWRLISPCFLHDGPFHLFFNMLWLLVIGMQMEQRIGIFRYLLFILLTGVFSNTAQYLMSGPNFLGFSGILCAMILFVWFRQKKAPWEGYQLLPTTMTFITVLILAFAALQVISFFLEIGGHKPVGTGIANTAHLSGGLAGYVLAQLNFFSWQTTKS